MVGAREEFLRDEILELNLSVGINQLQTEKEKISRQSTHVQMNGTICVSKLLIRGSLGRGVLRGEVSPEVREQEVTCPSGSCVLARGI